VEDVFIIKEGKHEIKKIERQGGEKIKEPEGKGKES